MRVSTLARYSDGDLEHMTEQEVRSVLVVGALERTNPPQGQPTNLALGRFCSARSESTDLRTCGFPALVHF